jgi:hypothetical protein
MAEQPKKSRRQWERFVELNVHQVPEEQLLTEMSADGFSQDEILALIKQKKKKSYGGYVALMVVGAVVALLGFGLTAASWSNAYDGDTHYVFWGAMLVGVITFFTGLIRMLLKK